MQRFYIYAHKRIRSFFAVACILLLSCACGAASIQPEPQSAQGLCGSASAEKKVEKKEALVLIENPVVIGITGWKRPEIAMLAMHHTHGNIIEIPQLVWADKKYETSDGRAINERILAFAEGYQDYVGGHPQGLTCTIQTTSHCIGMTVGIVMRKALNPSSGSDPQTMTVTYNHVLRLEEEGGFDNKDQEDMRALVVKGVTAATGLTAEDCVLAGYAHVRFGSLYFYDVKVKNAGNEPYMLSWACLNKGVLGKDRAVMTGAEAFSMLKRAYPNLPPDFDKECGDPGP